MNCLHPVLIRNPLYNKEPFGGRLDGLDIFSQPTIYVRCNHCYFCRKHRVSELALKLRHERQTSNFKSCFITLTYEDSYLPRYVSCDSPLMCGFDFGKRDFQLFMKRLRRYVDYHKLPYKWRYFACGEYGHLRGRCHYHALLFGVTKQEIEPIVIKCWKAGYIIKIKNCDANASYYVTKYMLKASVDSWFESVYYHDFQMILRDARVWLKESTCPTPRVHRFGPYSMKVRECRMCPVAKACYSALLACRRELKNYFMRAEAISFCWKSINIGKEYALDNMAAIIKNGNLHAGISRDGTVMYASVPQTYKIYISKALRDMSQDFTVRPWHEICFKSVDWKMELSKRLQTDNWKIFVADVLKSDECIQTDDLYIPQLCQMFDTWQCSRLLPKLEQKDISFEKQHPSRHF